MQPIILVRGSDATEQQITAFKALLSMGGQIPIADNVLTKNIKAAEYLALYYIDNELVAIGAIKNPQKSYKRKVFEKAGLESAVKDLFTYEIGYFVTLPGHAGKGYCASLVNALMGQQVLRDARLFATTKSPVMARIFEKYGFKNQACWATDSSDVMNLYTL